MKSHIIATLLLTPLALSASSTTTTTTADLSPNDIPLACIDICGPMVELSSICQIPVSGSTADELRKVKRREFIESQAASITQRAILSAPSEEEIGKRWAVTFSSSFGFGNKTVTQSGTVTRTGTAGAVEAGSKTSISSSSSKTKTSKSSTSTSHSTSRTKTSKTTTKTETTKTKTKTKTATATVSATATGILTTTIPLSNLNSSTTTSRFQNTTRTSSFFFYNTTTSSTTSTPISTLTTSSPPTLLTTTTSDLPTILDSTTLMQVGNAANQNQPTATATATSTNANGAASTNVSQLGQLSAVDMKRVQAAEKDCVCTNDSFDVARIAALCSSCISKAGFPMGPAEYILWNCNFTTEEWTRSKDSLAQNIVVKAKTPQVTGVNHASSPVSYSPLLLAAAVILLI